MPKCVKRVFAQKFRRLPGAHLSPGAKLTARGLQRFNRPVWVIIPIPHYARWNLSGVGAGGGCGAIVAEAAGLPALREGSAGVPPVFDFPRLDRAGGTPALPWLSGRPLIPPARLVAGIAGEKQKRHLDQHADHAGQPAPHFPRPRGIRFSCGAARPCSGTRKDSGFENERLTESSA